MLSWHLEFPLEFRKNFSPDSIKRCLIHVAIVISWNKSEIFDKTWWILVFFDDCVIRRIPCYPKQQISGNCAISEINFRILPEVAKMAPIFTVRVITHRGRSNTMGLIKMDCSQTIILPWPSTSCFCAQTPVYFPVSCFNVQSQSFFAVIILWTLTTLKFFTSVHP